MGSHGGVIVSGWDGGTPHRLHETACALRDGKMGLSHIAGSQNIAFYQVDFDGLDSPKERQLTCRSKPHTMCWSFFRARPAHQAGTLL